MHRSSIYALGHSLALTTALVVLASAACASAGGTEGPELYTPQFNYQPEEPAEPAEAEVTFAIVDPTYANFPVSGLKDTSELPGPFRDFARSFRTDFEEMLIERGYSTTGPFESYNRMTFPERKQVDLVLIPTFEFGTRTVDINYSSNFKVVTTTYTIEGTDRMSGHIVLAAMESLSGERMWFKKIDLPSTTVNWASAQDATNEYIEKQMARRNDADWSGILMEENDPGVINPLAKQLENYYSRALQATWDYLNPEEMSRLKVMADSLKTDYQPGD